MSHRFSVQHNALSQHAAGQQEAFTLQGLDADALASILPSINLQSEPAQRAADPSHEGTPGADGLAQNSPSQTMSSEGNAVAGQDMLVDCPLPFQESGPTAVTRTPARARRSKGELVDDKSDGELRVRTPILQKEKKRKDYAFQRQFNEKPSVIQGCPGPVLRVYFLCCINTATLRTLDTASL